MHRLTPLLIRLALLLAVVCVSAPAGWAQKHSLGSAPPTAPPMTVPHPTASTTLNPAPIVRQPVSPAHVPGAATPVSGPVAAISTGLGAIQYFTSSMNVPAPQTLTRQLSSEDERTRIGALTSLGAPGQYLTHGHASVPHSMQLDMLELSNTQELDALVTVELDQHVVSAVLVPDGGNWRRVATLMFASSFNAGATTPSNFVRPLRSWLEPGRYRAVYHATVNGTNGDFTENEADIRVLNGRAAVVISFVSGARQCDATGQLRPPHQTCELIQRWIEPDPIDPIHHFTLITGLGHISAHEADDPLSQSRNYRLTRLRSFACQPLIFSEGAQHFEPTANSAPCVPREAANAQHADHPTVSDHSPPADRP